MHALITGGAGFIGSHLADELIERGHRVTVLDNLTTGGHENIRHLHQHAGFKFALGSILDDGRVQTLAKECDVIFHLAAAVGVKLIVERPLESLLTNIRGTEVVLDAAFRHGKKTLLTSTSEIYGKSAELPMHEDGDRLLGSPLVGRWSYSTSKAVDEILAHAYWKDKGLPTVIVRLFNTVGPRQTAEFGMVLPRFVEAAMARRDLLVYGDGSQSRCFIHVGDVVPALIDLMECEEAEGLAVNIGSTEEVTMSELAELVIEVTGSPSKIRHIPYDEAYGSNFEDMTRRVPDINRARKLIGFEPRASLREIVEAMILDAGHRHL